MRQSVQIHIDKDYEIGRVDPRLFGSFAEHLGRCIYTGLYEPEHPTADEHGFRGDVLELVRELNVTHVRYPGGNFLSGYDWKDGIGPKRERPTRLDLAWKSVERNQFGIDEFCLWSRLAGTGMTVGVNMGTGTPKDAAELVEYCNHPGGTYWSDLRRKHGIEAPMDVRLWCIGNEMDGPWQICHLDAEDYGRKARETAKLMKWADGRVELVACGSSHPGMPSFPAWDRTVLEYAYEQVDYLSMHRYYENEGNRLDFLASFKDMDSFIGTLCATADYVKAVKRSPRTMYFSFDEWNVWYQKRFAMPRDWAEAPDLLADRYSLLDALAFAGLGMALINRCDRVKIACLAQLVNVIAPIRTEEGGRVLRQATFWPFKLLSLYGRGRALKPAVKTPLLETKYGDAEQVFPCAVLGDDGVLTLFCLNIAEAETPVELDLRSFGKRVMREHYLLCGDDLDAVNSFDAPDAVVVRPAPCAAEPADTFSLRLPGLSWSVYRFGE